MKFDYFSDHKLEAVFKQVDLRNSESKFQSHVILGCDENDWSNDDLDDWLKQQPVDVFGAVFPQVIFNRKHYKQGFVLISFTKRIEYTLVHGLSGNQCDFEQMLDETAQDWERLDHDNTIFVLADGMSSRIAALIEALFFNFGLSRNFVGGGAGSLSFQQKPCILSPKGFNQDVALLLNLPWQSGVGVSHGWQPITEELKVSKSDRNIIQELNYRNAYSEYKAIVDAHTGESLQSDNFFDLAKRFPFGISKLNSEVVVRDPLMPTDDQKGLICVGEVPEECFVRILSSTSEALINAAATARQRASADWHERYSNKQPKAGFFVDCISRVLFLEQEIEAEIAQVAGDLPIFGAFTLGEIANSGQEYLEFYNKTCVLCVLGEG